MASITLPTQERPIRPIDGSSKAAHFVPIATKGNAIMLARYASLLLAALTLSNSAQAADPLDGAALYADVLTYDAFGTHRYGSRGAERAMDWIENELRTAGLTTSSQALSMPRQYDFEEASLTVGDKLAQVVPHWWLPLAQGSLALTAPIVSEGEATGAFVRLTLPYDRAAYLTQAHKDALAAALARKPAAVLLTIQHPSGEPYVYNVDQAQEPWPVPVIVVGAKDKAMLDEAEQGKKPLTLVVKGGYRSAVAGRNVIGRLDRGKAKTLVISTPVTSWFTSSCERGPGIAGFLAMARIGKEAFPDANLIFIATGGHEIGHGGMEEFLKDGAPKPDQVAAWAHFGASLGCYVANQSEKGLVVGKETNEALRVILRSEAMDASVTTAFAAVKGAPLVGKQAGVGELRDIASAGYPRFFGMAGLHLFFHTPADRAELTGPALLEPVARAFATVLRDAAKP